jgi:beta-glucosidase/6-phospho-beta-glucosidase/beta-galactosidase
MKQGKESNIQQIWDLNHFDYPEYIDPFSTQFTNQFAEYARKCISLIRKYQPNTIFIAPINEISFFAWIGADIGNWAPFTKGKDNGFAFKKQLVKAAIEAMKAIREEDHDVKFIHIDPFMRRKARMPIGKSARKHVEEFNNIIRYEAWDLLSGKKMPELGGDKKYMDFIGVNYYFHNQEWVISPKKKGGHIQHRAMAWNSKDRVSFADMLNDVYKRYECPLIVTETGSYGKKRQAWWERIFKEVDEAIKRNIPIYGVCAYPVLDRPSWEHFLLPQSGLWDFAKKDDECTRHPYSPALDVIKKNISKFQTY